MIGRETSWLFKTTHMNNILLLTDFSEASYHAGRYAALLTQQLRSERLIIYHSYEVNMPVQVSEIPVAPGTYPPEVAMEDGLDQRRRSLQQLRSLYEKLRGVANEKTIMEYRAEEATLVSSINDIAKEVRADLIVMAITVAGKLEQALIGNEAIRVADQSKYPVLIVPPEARLGPVNSIVFACDLKKSKEKTPVRRLKKLLDDFRAQLLVVHVDHHENALPSETFQQAAVLDHWLDVYHPAYHSVDNTDPATGIMEFAKTRNASLIIAIHKSRGFFEGLFHRSATHQLAYHTSIPLLVMQAEE
jgi:nucleotide-binding universal stress UspA family protein